MTILSSRHLLIGPVLPQYEPRAMPEPIPTGFSRLEWAVYRELRRRAEPFSMQVDIAGGQGFMGGMRVDFILANRPVVLRVMGFWHSLPGAQERDAQGRSYLEAQGYRVIDLYPEDIEIDLAGTLDRELGIGVAL